MPTDNTTNPLLITYGTRTLDFSTLPQASLVAMLRRGVSHYFGSEQASKVTAYFDPEHDDAANRPDTKEARDAKKAEYQQAAYEALVAGTVGVSVRGPQVDPISTIINRLAKEEIRTILAGMKLKYPAKADDVIELPNGDKITGPQLIARRLDKDGPAGVDKKTGVAHIDRLRKEAEKIAAEKAKKNKKLQETAEDAVL
jgi:hypothetical protein